MHLAHSHDESTLSFILPFSITPSCVLFRFNLDLSTLTLVGVWQDIFGAGEDEPVKCRPVCVCVFVSEEPCDSAGLNLSDLDRVSQQGVLGVCQYEGSGPNDSAG